MTTYTTDTPKRAGFYWYLKDPDCRPSIVRVFKDTDGYWSVQYNQLQVHVEGWSDEIDVGVDYLINYLPGFFSYIARPETPEWTEPVDSFETND